MELNPKIPIIIAIIIFFVILSGIPFALIKVTFFPNPINKTVNETNNTVFIYRNITVTVSPTPDGKQYFAGEYQSGIRKMGRWFSWYRPNVLGKKDLSCHVKVYDYRMFEHIHVFDPSDYKYYEVKPNQEGMKYLFIFVKIYVDDVSGDDVRPWLQKEDHYYAQINGTLYTPIGWEKRLRIKELEETFNDNDDFRIAYYGVFNTYSRDKRYASTAGEVAEDLYYVMGGESNAIDGYIVYYIPTETKEEDVLILGNMDSFGQPAWTLKT